MCKNIRSISKEAQKKVAQAKKEKRMFNVERKKHERNIRKEERCIFAQIISNVQMVLLSNTSCKIIRAVEECKRKAREAEQWVKNWLLKK